MPSIRDVASLAGVSQSTVSNVFVGRVPVRPEKRQRVLDAASALGYHPNGAAQVLRTGRSRALGLLVSFVTNPTDAAVVQGASRVARAAGYVVTVALTEGNAEQEIEALDLLARQRVAAVIAYAASGEAAPYRDLQATGCPFVFIGGRPQGLEADLVRSDSYSGTLDAARHLLALGRRRIGLLLGVPWRDTTNARHQAYRDALAEFGVACDEALVRRRVRTAAEGYAAADDLLAARVDAILAAVTPATVGVASALADCGVRVPEDVALIGTGDMEWARLLTPPLAMIEQNGEELGRLAATMAIERIGGSAGAPREERLPAVFKARASAGGPALERGVEGT
jgi:LacI family transcriptional regulator